MSSIAGWHELGGEEALEVVPRGARAGSYSRLDELGPLALGRLGIVDSHGGVVRIRVSASRYAYLPRSGAAPTRDRDRRRTHHCRGPDITTRGRPSAWRHALAPICGFSGVGRTPVLTMIYRYCSGTTKPNRSLSAHTPARSSASPVYPSWKYSTQPVAASACPSAVSLTLVARGDIRTCR